MAKLLVKAEMVDGTQVVLRQVHNGSATNGQNGPNAIKITSSGVTSLQILWRLHSWRRRWWRRWA